MNQYTSAIAPKQVEFDLWEQYKDQIDKNSLAVDIDHGLERLMKTQSYVRFNFHANNGERDYTEVLINRHDPKMVGRLGIVESVFNEWLDKVNYVAPEVEALKEFIQHDDRPLKDSGQRREFDTGSRRDIATGKGRFDLLPFEVIEALAKHYEKGSGKYGDDNWKKGQPLSVYLDSALRHTMKWAMGQRDEDHLIAAIWNLIAAWWTQQAIRKDDLPKVLGDAGELKAERADYDDDQK